MEDWRTSTEGERAVRFLNNLTHTGDYSGKPFDLRPWQEEPIRQLFGTIGSDGLRQYSECFLFLPRKNAKTEICAGIGNYCLLGTGKSGQEIYCCASDREQAARLYNAAAQMIRCDPYLDSICDIKDSKKQIVVPRSGNVLQALSSDAHRKHGYNPSVVLFDELHTQPNRALWDVMTSGSGTRLEPLTIAITTAGTSKESLAYEQFEYAKRVKADPSLDPTYLPLLYYADEEEDWGSEQVWRKANPALGDFLQLRYLQKKFLKAQMIPTEEAAFRQLHLNQWVQSERRFLTRQQWDDSGEKFDVDELLGMPCFGGLDVGLVRDLSALALVFRHQGGFRVLVHFWLPEKNIVAKENTDKVPYRQWAKKGFLTLTPGEVTDFEHIRVEANKLASKYQIQKLFTDPHAASELIINLAKDCLPVIPFRQNFPMMNAPTRELERLVIGKKIHHNGNPILGWNVENAVTANNADGYVKLVKQSSFSAKRIDGLIAVVMGIAGAISENIEASVYQDRGVIVL